MSSPAEKAGLTAQLYPPGTLKKSIYQTRVSDECRRDLEVWKIDVRVGSRTDRKGGRRAGAFYASWVEYGHHVAPRGKRLKRGSGRAEQLASAQFVPPHPFMRPAFEQTRQSALAAMQQYLTEHLEAGALALSFLKSKGAI